MIIFRLSKILSIFVNESQNLSHNIHCDWA